MPLIFEFVGTPATSTAPRRRRGLKRFTRNSPPSTLCCCPGVLKRAATQRRPATRRLALTCQRQQCNLGDAEESDDAATLLPCSFCNLSYHNSAGCLGKAGGAILSEREAKNEEHEWACPPCWAGALAKARRATQGLVATRVVVGKKTSQKKSKKASKK